MKKMRFIRILLIASLVFVSIPVVLAENITLKDTSKSIAIIYTIDGENVTYVDSEMFYGHSPEYIPKRELTAKSLGKEDLIIRNFGIADPRIIYREDGGMFKDNTTFGIIIPFSENLVSVGIYNATSDKMYLKSNLTPTIQKFCKENPDDVECIHLYGNGSLSLVPIFVIAGALLIAGICLVVFIQGRKKNG